MIDSMMSLRRRSDDGATAIEYALIAALIGIGLIGSLVGTRGSLNGIFNTASSQMASAGSAPSADLSPLAAYWATKTIASTSVANGATTFRYTDGSIATLGSNAIGGKNINARDAANLTIVSAGVDATGKLITTEIDTYYDAGFQHIKSTMFASKDNAASVSNGVIVGEYVGTYSPTGSSTSWTPNGTPTDQFIAQTASNLTLIPYFQGLAAGQ